MKVEDLIEHIQQLKSNEEEKQESIKKCLDRNPEDDIFITDDMRDDLEDNPNDSYDECDDFNAAMRVIKKVLRKSKKMKVRKKPVIVNAWQLPDAFTSHNFFDFQDNLPKDIGKLINFLDDPYVKKGKFVYTVKTLEGTMQGLPGDYLIQGNHNDVWIIKKDIFEDTYEIVDEQ